MTYRQLADALYQVSQPTKGHFLGVAFQGPSWTTATLSNRKDANKWLASMKQQATASFLYDDGTKGLLSKLGNTSMETGITVDPSQVSGPEMESMTVAGPDGTPDFAPSADPEEATFPQGKDFGTYIDRAGVTWHVAQHNIKANQVNVLVDYLTGQAIPQSTTQWVAWIASAPNANVHQATGSEDAPNVAALNSAEIVQAIDEWVDRHSPTATVRGDKKTSSMGWLILAAVAYFVFTDGKRRRR